jgi:hypothetical protein
MTDLQSLLSRLEKAQEGNWRLDKAISEKVVGRTYFGGLDQRFSRSVDAALSLVPEGLMVSMTIGHGQAVANVKTGSILNPETREWPGYAKTPALALVVAALRARGA